MINEDNIIKTLKATSGGFIGDDAAILPSITPGQKYVITKDLLVEDVHFRTSYFSPFDLAHKALHVNLSDIAAMGAQALYILCGISIPNHLHDYAMKFLRDLSLVCQKENVLLIGGDTTASRDYLHISITATGTIAENHVKYRNGAKTGDLICLAGHLGFAHLGFLTLEQSLIADAKYINSFLRPEAKIKEGIWLGAQPSVHSMIDLSDGLYVDLRRLCLASNKSAILNADLLEADLPPEISLQIALEGGEDYGLLSTISPESFKSLSQEFLKTFGYGLKVIGHIDEGEGILFKQGGQLTDITVNPFTHFGEKL